MNRVEQKTIRAGGEMLKRGGRIRTGVQAIPVQDGARLRPRIDQPVRRSPSLEPSARARPQRSREMRVSVEEVMGRAGRRLVVLACQPIEHGEVELGVVD